MTLLNFEFLSNLNINACILAFLPSLINLGIFIYSYFFFPKSKLSVIFSFIVFSAFVWQLSQGFLMITTDIQQAKRIYLLIQLGAILTISNCFYFSLVYTGLIKKELKAIVVTLIYLPGIFLIISYTLRWLPYQLQYTPILGYVNIIFDHPIFVFESIFFSSYGLAVFIILLRYWIVSKNKKIKLPAGIITIGYSIPFLQGICTEIILPNLFNSPPITLTVTFITFFSLASIISLKKYNFLTFSPFKVTNEIVNSINDALIIADNKGVIKYANPALLKMLNYTEVEILDKEGFFILAKQSDKKVLEKMTKIRMQGESSRYEMDLKTKEGLIINTIISASPYMFNKKITGSLAVIHDITLEKQKNKMINEAVISGEEKERKRLSQELHDGVLQNMVVVNMNLEALCSKNLIKTNHSEIKKILAQNKISINELRNVSHNLYTLKEDELLCMAINRLIESYTNTNIKFSLNVDGKKPDIMSSSVTTNIYRVIQEFINNSIKHAKPSIISINISYLPKTLNITISDNGCGFNYEDKLNLNKGIGLRNMQSRIQIVNGDFTLNSTLNQGTKLFVSIPI